MKKLLVLLLLPLFSFGQELNKTNDGYTEVVDIELSKKEIYQKVNEWVALNYNLAQDNMNAVEKFSDLFIQLNTVDKVIVKGNFYINFKVRKYVLKYRIHNTLAFSIRDNKYKIDLVPNSAKIIDYTPYGGAADSSIFKQYISDVIYTKDEFLKYSVDASMKQYLDAGFSEKKAKNWADKYAKNKIDDSYKSYLINKYLWDGAITSTFISIKESISSSNTDDDW